jgi:hypothetical protein
LKKIFEQFGQTSGVKIKSYILQIMFHLAKAIFAATSNRMDRQLILWELEHIIKMALPSKPSKPSQVGCRQ